MADDRLDRLPKVTPFLMGRGLDLCPRRLACELDDHARDAGPFLRWRLRTPFVLAATLAHAAPAAPTAADFPVPPDLEPEEERVWATAVDGYVRRFGDVVAVAVAHGCEQATVSRRHGVRVGGAVDVLVELDGDDVELRQLELWGRPVRADPHESWELGLAVLRLARVLAGRRLRIRHVDLLGDGDDVVDFDYETDLGPLAARFGERVAELRARAADPEAAPGVDCAGCAFVAGCPPHRGRYREVA